MFALSDWVRKSGQGQPSGPHTLAVVFIGGSGGSGRLVDRRAVGKLFHLLMRQTACQTAAAAALGVRAVKVQCNAVMYNNNKVH